MSTESTSLVIIPGVEASKLALITPDSALSVKAAYLPHFTAFLELEKQASQIAVNSPKLARLMRLDLRKVRVAAEKDRLSLGNEAKRYKEAVDQVYNLLEDRLKPVEQRMESIERAEEIAIKEKAEALKVGRLAELAPYGQDNVFYDLANLPESQYVALRDSQKTAHEAKLAAAAKAEADRAAAEQARLKREADLAAENTRLAKEAEAARKAKVAADQAAAEERGKAEAERARIQKQAADQIAAQAKAAADEAARLKKVADDKLAKERAERDAADKLAKEKAAQERIESEAKAKRERDVAQAEADKRQKALEAKLAQEREASAKVAQQLAAKQAAEDAKIAAQTEALHRAATASDREKLGALSTAIRTLKVPTLTNEALHAKILDQFARMAKWIDTEGSKL